MSHDLDWEISLEGTFLKISEIQQSDEADSIALAYQDNGEFHVKIVSRFNRSLMRNDNLVEYKPGESISDICIQNLFQLDYGSKPIHGIYNPLITCCFLPNDRLFVAAYHRVSAVQCHFIWDIENDKVDGLIATIDFP